MPWERWMITDWKKITHSAFHFLAQTPSSYTDRIPTNISRLSWKVRHSVGWAYKQVFPTALATHCLTLFLHTSGLLDFFAPNPGRLHIACSRRRGGGRLGGIPLKIEGRCCQPRRMGVEEERLRPPRRLPGVIAADMAGFWLAVWRHFLGGFLAGRSRHCRALEVWACQCGRKSPLFVWVW